MPYIMKDWGAKERMEARYRKLGSRRVSWFKNQLFRFFIWLGV